MAALLTMRPGETPIGRDARRVHIAVMRRQQVIAGLKAAEPDIRPDMEREAIRIF
jgi:hypothetical protein